MNIETALRTDNHTHILFADIGAMLGEAKKHNLSEYSITEHVSQFREPREKIDFGAVHLRGRIFKDVAEYNQEFRKVDPATLCVKVNRGLEVDFSPRYEKEVAEFVNQSEWDILICSVHELEDGESIEKKAGLSASRASVHKLWHDYLQLELSALESDFISFDVLSHPVRMSRATRTVPRDFDALLMDLARAAKKRDKALELNGNDIGQSADLVRRLAVACSKADCSVSLGSDAHHPNEVFRNIRVGMRLIDEFKLKLASL